MPSRKSVVWVGVSFLVAAGVALAQANSVVVAMAGQAGSISGRAISSTGGGIFRPVTGLPYSAEQVTERVQTLADGTHITDATQTTMLYRDSAGRTRTEHKFTPPPGRAGTFTGPTFVEINDPVAGYRYTLDSQNHVAHRMAWPPVAASRADTGGVKAVQGSTAPASSASAGGENPVATQRQNLQTSRESLGAQTIEGLNAEGTRFTTIYPVGFMGNDQPITTVRETWMSTELKLMVISRVTDPRNGESTTKLTNVSQTEPDATLFQVPAEYTIEDAQQGAVVH